VHPKSSRRVAAALLAVATMALLPSCTRPSTAEPRQQPPAQMEHVGSNYSVVLTPIGVERVGLRTAPATADDGATEVPIGALLYEPDGRAAVYVETGTLSYTIDFVTVASISGDQVLISQGLIPGTVIVTQGAEELLGVQNGIGVET
jgi:hypothetical protein